MGRGGGTVDGEGKGRRTEGIGSPASGGSVAEVVLDVAGREIDRPFDYLVPAHLSAVAGCGCRVRVPFGSRKVEGWVVGRKEAAEACPVNIIHIFDGNNKII